MHKYYYQKMNPINLSKNQDTMDFANVSLQNKNPYFTEIIRFLYESLLSKWFYVPTRSRYISQKPEFSFYPKGFRLGNRWIYSILYTRDEYEMRTTDADAIIANFFIISSQEKLKRVLSAVGKPVIISIGFEHIIIHCISGLIQKLEKAGAAGFYTPGILSNGILKKICSECSVPVISSTGVRSQEIISKIDAGTYAVCITGKNISKELVRSLHESNPNVPVIAFCNKSEKSMINSIKSGIDAVIYKPCVPFEEDKENSLG